MARNIVLVSPEGYEISPKSNVKAKIPYEIMEYLLIFTDMGSPEEVERFADDAAKNLKTLNGFCLTDKSQLNKNLAQIKAIQGAAKLYDQGFTAQDNSLTPKDVATMAAGAGTVLATLGKVFFKNAASSVRSYTSQVKEEIRNQRAHSYVQAVDTPPQATQLETQAAGTGPKRYNPVEIDLPKI